MMKEKMRVLILSNVQGERMSEISDNLRRGGALVEFAEPDADKLAQRISRGGDYAVSDVVAFGIACKPCDAVSLLRAVHARTG
jgi:hypothetical protein